MRDVEILKRYPRCLELAEDGGAWLLKSRIDGRQLKVIASWGSGWDHVSVSTSKRPPTWREMCVVRRLFFRDDETAMQLHPPLVDHVNIHPNCLHLWRPQGVEIPRPPQWMV